jgi:hypothetical protein
MSLIAKIESLLNFAYLEAVRLIPFDGLNIGFFFIAFVKESDFKAIL